MGEVRVLSLHQPWASLVALGVKRIETRSWSTKYRGRMLIHAAKRLPVSGPLGDRVIDLLGTPTWFLAEPWTEDQQIAAGRSPDGDLIGFPLPLGAVVASCTLTDCVSMVEDADDDPNPVACLDVGGGIALRLYAEGSDEGDDVSDQLPFGDFAPGRWAWLLDDVQPTSVRCPRCWNQFEGRMPGHVYGSNWDWVPCQTCMGAGVCEPVPMRGAQGLRKPVWGG